VECKCYNLVSNFPNKTHTAVPIASTASHSAQNIALNELGRTINNGRIIIGQMVFMKKIKNHLIKV
jgi:Homoserine acetyltransferase